MNGDIYTTTNPIEKIIELHEERIALYERMLKEDEMMERLEKLWKEDNSRTLISNS